MGQDQLHQEHRGLLILSPMWDCCSRSLTQTLLLFGRVFLSFFLFLIKNIFLLPRSQFLNNISERSLVFLYQNIWLTWVGTMTDKESTETYSSQSINQCDIKGYSDQGTMVNLTPHPIPLSRWESLPNFLTGWSVWRIDRSKRALRTPCYMVTNTFNKL